MRIGADYLVVGKPIRDAKDPREAARQIVREMEQGLTSSQERRVSFVERQNDDKIFLTEREELANN
jgi:hypothetical protein